MSADGTAEPSVLIAVDLGGTQIRTAVVPGPGRLLSRRSVATPARGGPPAVIATVLAEVRRAADAAGRPIRAVAVSALGPVDPRTGVIRSAPTIADFTEVPLRAELTQALGLPVRVYNDANAAAVAEWRLGAGRGTRDFCYVTVSTGIGCGIISDGRLLVGHTGHAGEFGRTRIARSGGAPARLEEVSSGTAIAAAARAALRGPAPSSLRELADPAAVTGVDVAAAAAAGDGLAGSLLAAAAGVLGLHLANLVRLLEPELIALGGGVTGAGEPFWRPLRHAVAESLAQDDIPVPRLGRAELGGDAGLHGAALCLLEEESAGG